MESSCSFLAYLWPIKQCLVAACKRVSVDMWLPLVVIPWCIHGADLRCPRPDGNWLVHSSIRYGSVSQRSMYRFSIVSTDTSRQEHQEPTHDDYGSRIQGVMRPTNPACIGIYTFKLCMYFLYFLSYSTVVAPTSSRTQTVAG